MIKVANPTDSVILVIDRVFETFMGSLVGTIVALISARMRSERIAANEVRLLKDKQRHTGCVTLL